MFFTFLTTWRLTTPGRTFSARSLKVAGTIMGWEMAGSGETAALECLTAWDTPNPVPVKSSDQDQSEENGFESFSMFHVVPP